MRATFSPSAPGLTLHAGPLRATFDRGELRWVSLGDLEILRGITPAVRGPAWQTVPPHLDALRVEQQESSFLVAYEARHEHGPLRFSSSARIEGAADGTLRFLFDGRAETTFLKNRIGLCVLHPIALCAGRPCEVEHGDGRITRSPFPYDVSPHQPFVDIRAIRYGAAPGRWLEVFFEGEWFEMEDQRNWSDASFKTYSTPLSIPFPARMEPDQRVRHEVTLRLLDRPAQPAEGSVASATEGDPGTGPGPAAESASRLRVGLDLGDAKRALSAAEIDRLRPLRLDHLRVGLSREDVGGDSLRRAAEMARACGTRLEVAALVGEDGDLEHLAEAAAGLPVATFLVFNHDTRRSDPDLLSRARHPLRAAVPGARIGGGTDAWFADLNRNREAAKGADVVAFELCPQVHARDEATILENLASLPDIARTARAFADANAELFLTPVTLAPREQDVDRRLRGDFGGVWVRGLLEAAGTAGFASLTLRPAFGPGGMAGDETAAYRALRDRPRG